MKTHYIYRDARGTGGGVLDESTHEAILRYSRLVDVATIRRWVRVSATTAECLHCRAHTTTGLDAWARSHYCPEVVP